MLEEISKVFKDTLNKLEQQKAQTVSMQLAAAKNELIAPRYQVLEKERDEKIAQINAEAQAKINAARLECDESKRLFESYVTDTITTKVNNEYETALAKLRANLDE